MKKILAIADGISKAFMWLSALLAMSIVFLTVQQVIFRYLFQSSSVAIQELTWHFFGAMFLLAGAHTYKSGQHVRVDILSRKMSSTFQKNIERIGILFFYLPTCVVLIWSGADFFMQAREFAMGNEETFAGWILSGEGSPDPGGLPARWIIRAMIPLSGILMAVQGLSQFVKTFGPPKKEEVT